MSTGMLEFKILADRSVESREVMHVVKSYELVPEVGVVFRLEDAERRLVNPDTPGYDHEAWPLAGMVITEVHDKTTVGTSRVAELVSRGLASYVNSRRVHRSAGPPENPWRDTHTFVHADQIVFHTLDGDVTYDVTEQPDKWPDEKDDESEAGYGGKVDHFYTLKLAKAVK